MLEGVDDVVQNVFEQQSGMGKYFPAVPALEAAKVNSVSAEKYYRNNKYPAVFFAQLFAHKAMDLEEGGITQHQAGPCKHQYQSKVIPKGHNIVFMQVDQVGEYIRRIGKEQQPGGEQQ